MYIGRQNSECEQKEVDYLEFKIKPVLSRVVQSLIDKRPADPVPSMIRRVKELQEEEFSRRSDFVESLVQRELDCLEQEMLGEGEKIGTFIRDYAEFAEYQRLTEKKALLQSEIDAALESNNASNQE